MDFNFHDINDNEYEWIDDDNIDDYIHQLTIMKTNLLVKYKIEYYKYERDQIDKFVKERCDNYKENQRRMIDSITNREIKHVTIDKIYKEINGQEFLFTEDNIIKEETNKHFQTVAGAVNMVKNLNEKDNKRWNEQYKPKGDIDGKIYQYLMEQPTWEEWIETVKLLPNGKAAGPSKISYEMIKHVADELQQVIYNLICACIRFNDIPDEWRNATIYPIPKPKPYNCNLMNTR